MTASSFLKLRYSMIGVQILWIVIMELVAFLTLHWIDEQGAREIVFTMLACISIVLPLGLAANMVHAATRIRASKREAMLSAIFILSGFCMLVVIFFAVVMAGLLLVGFS